MNKTYVLSDFKSERATVEAHKQLAEAVAKVSAISICVDKTNVALFAENPVTAVVNGAESLTHTAVGGPIFKFVRRVIAENLMKPLMQMAFKELLRDNRQRAKVTFSDSISFHFQGQQCFDFQVAVSIDLGKWADGLLRQTAGAG